MSWPDFTTLQETCREQRQLADGIVERIEASLPAAAKSPFHRQMASLVQRVADLLEHPVIFFFHTVLYLRRAVKHSRQWANTLRNITLSEDCIQRTAQHVEKARCDTPESKPVETALGACPEPVEGTASPPSPSRPLARSQQARLRIRAWADGLRHEKYIVTQFPDDATPPDLTPINIGHSRPRSSSAPNTPFLAQRSRYPFLDIFVTPTLWHKKVTELEAELLKHLTRAQAELQRQILQHRARLATSCLGPVEEAGAPSSGNSSSSHMPPVAHMPYPSDTAGTSPPSPEPAEGSHSPP